MINFAKELKELKDRLADPHHRLNCGIRGIETVNREFLQELIGHFEREGALLRQLDQEANLDAERLDWIDEQGSDFNHGVVLGMHFIKGKSGQQFHGRTLRTAIDSALAVKDKP